MSDFNRSEAYDFSLFDIPVVQSSAAPQTENIPAPQPEEKIKTSAQTRKEAISSAVRPLKIFVVSALLAVLFGAVLVSKISLVLIGNEKADYEAKINEARSENTRLVMQLNSSASIDKIDAYAASVLGMHKLERYQIHYFENRDGDKVVVANGKAVEEKANADG